MLVGLAGGKKGKANVLRFSSEGQATCANAKVHICREAIFLELPRGVLDELPRDFPAVGCVPGRLRFSAFSKRGLRSCKRCHVLEMVAECSGQVVFGSFAKHTGPVGYSPGHGPATLAVGVVARQRVFWGSSVLGCVCAIFTWFMWRRSHEVLSASQFFPCSHTGSRCCHSFFPLRVPT